MSARPTLRPLTAELIDAVVAAAAAGASPAEVMPVDAAADPAWTDGRRAVYTTFLRSRLRPLADGRRESSFVVRLGPETVGLARLAADGAGAVEVGLWLARRARGHGAGGAVLEQLATIARERGATRLVADTTADNVAAVRALTRAGAQVGRTPEGAVEATVDL